MIPSPTDASAHQPPGFASRHAAVELLEGVLYRRRPLDEQLDGKDACHGFNTLPERDRALARRIVATTLRRLGTLRRVVGELLNRGLPEHAPRVESALLTGAAQILFLDIPHHAAVDLSVRLVQGDRRHARYAGLVNAVLRRIARNGIAQRDGEPCLDTPEWLLARWTRTYGENTARAIAHANGLEPSLDLTVKTEPDQWAARLHGSKLPTGSVRLVPHGPISALPGYAEGSWWIQDAAAALPARLFGDLQGRAVADLCAAPGGKTAQLALGGAKVTAVDRSEFRMARLHENMLRTGFAVQTVIASAETWTAGEFDAVLLDAPCTSTGTIRRHPDIPWRKAPADVALLAGVQSRLLARAIDLAKPGGTIVFCTCSLEPEEGEQVIAGMLAQDPRIRRHPLAVAEFPDLEGFITPLGDLRTLPCQWPDADPRMSGLDGFFAARLERV
jgi:16S rRNA (cytosine967-C5)-methyltransferase